MAQKVRQDISIGSTIRSLRMRSGLSQEQVVAKMQLLGCSLSRSIYSQIEGGTYNIRVSELKALTVIFHTDQCTKDYSKNGLPTCNFYRSAKERYFIFPKPV